MYLFLQVWHSKKVNEEELEAWVILHISNFTIYAAHCTVAGLGECCTHVAALLFFINHMTSQVEKAVTEMLAYWINSGKVYL